MGMDFTLEVVLLAGGIFAAMLGCLEIGRRYGARRRAQDPEDAGAGVVDGAVFALLGLLVAFTFSGAASRFDERRKLIIEEANAIGTAYLRLDLLPAAAQGELRARFRDYLDSRLAVYRALPDLDKSKAELARAGRLQQEIWSKSVASATGSQGRHHAAAAGAQRDDRHHHHAHDGRRDAPAEDRLRPALRARAAERAPRRSRHGERQGARRIRMAAYAFTLAAAVYVTSTSSIPGSA